MTKTDMEKYIWRGGGVRGYVGHAVKRPWWAKNSLPAARHGKPFYDKKWLDRFVRLFLYGDDRDDRDSDARQSERIDSMEHRLGRVLWDLACRSPRNRTLERVVSEAQEIWGTQIEVLKTQSRKFAGFRIIPGDDDESMLYVLSRTQAQRFNHAP